MSGRPTANYLVIGGTPPARRVCAALASETPGVTHLHEPDDRALRRALADDPDGVAILVARDTSALRYALAVRHLHAHVPIVVSVFDRTTTQQLQELLPHCTVFSPADLLAPTLAGLCAAPGLLALHHIAGASLATRRRHGVVTAGPWQPEGRMRRRALLGRVRGQLRPLDSDARLLLGGLFGIVTVLAADWIWLTAALHQSASTALLTAARVIAGVGPADPHPGHPGYQVASALMMLATLGLTALLTAGLVNRLMGTRLTGIIGRRTVPRSGHVLVVGIGHIGLRLCQTLRQAGIPVIGIERNPNAANLRLARALGIPVVLAHAEDRRILQRLGLHRARALAAVGSDELDNIAVAVAAHAVAPGIRVVLRAGEDEAIAETRSLLPLGHTRDINRASATFVVAHLTGDPPRLLVADTDDDYLDLPGRGLVPAGLPAHDDCDHLSPMPCTRVHPLPETAGA